LRTIGFSCRVTTSSRLLASPATIGERRNAYRVFVEKPEEEKHMEDLDVNGRIILRLFTKWERGGVLDGCGLGQVEVGVYPR